MKNKAIAIIKSTKRPQEKFNEFLNILILSSGNPNLIRSYNARGYTEEGLVSLEYDIKQHLQISDSEIRNFKEEELKINTQEAENKVTVGHQPLKSRFSEILQELNDEEKTGLKLSTSYPFLRDENCPVEFKILVNDAITAFTKAKEKHEVLQAVGDKEEAENNEEIYAIAEDLLKNFELNREIHAELEHYAKTGEVLGEHEIFGDLRLQRKVDAMSMEDLAKARNNVKSNISKAKKKIEESQTAEDKEKHAKKLAEFEKEQSLINERLKAE